LGSPAPTVKLRTATGQEVSLQDFRGKIIYLNFWSSKCLTCQTSTPDARQLMSNLANKNILLVNVNVDGNEGLVKNLIPEGTSTGLQLYAVDKAEVIEKYKLSDLPAYYLIDTDGTFITTQAKRPHQDGVNAKVFQALLD
jgi:thiol-disulfide isomerase/thioredoxin